MEKVPKNESTGTVSEVIEKKEPIEESTQSTTQTESIELFSPENENPVSEEIEKREAIEESKHSTSQAETIEVFSPENENPVSEEIEKREAIEESTQSTSQAETIEVLSQNVSPGKELVIDAILPTCPIPLNIQQFFGATSLQISSNYSPPESEEFHSLVSNSNLHYYIYMS